SAPPAIHTLSLHDALPISPTFEFSAIVSMLVVALVTMTETTGDLIAVGEMTDRRIEPRSLSDGLRADGLLTVLGGVFNTFPYTRSEEHTSELQSRSDLVCR